MERVAIATTTLDHYPRGLRIAEIWVEMESLEQIYYDIFFIYIQI